jgi:hypothetical protein
MATAAPVKRHAFPDAAGGVGPGVVNRTERSLHERTKEP